MRIKSYHVLGIWSWAFTDRDGMMSPSHNEELWWSGGLSEKHREQNEGKGDVVKEARVQLSPTVIYIAG